MGEATGVPSSYDPKNGASAYGDPIPNDYYYTCVTKNDEGDYDWEPDLFIGRFPAQDPDQLNNIIDKTVYYESECSFENWRKTMVHYNFNESFDSHFTEVSAAEFYRWVQEDLLPPNYVSTLKIVNGFEEESMV